METIIFYGFIKFASMKKIITNNSLIALVVAMFFFAGCKKKDTTTTPVKYGSLSFHIITNIATTVVDSGIVGVDASGIHFQMNLAEFYISDITLHATTGKSVDLSSVYLLKTLGKLDYFVDSIPVGEYSSISFNVGVAAAANAKLPTDNSAASPLYTQVPSMWFGSTTLGYIFMNVQGKADTSAANTGTVNYPFTMQLGGNASLKTVNMPTLAFSVTENTAQTITVIADYGKLFQGITFGSLFPNPTTSYSNPGVCSQIANNIPTMFRY